MPNTRKRQIAKIYSREYTSMYKELPRKKKKQAKKDFNNRFIKPKKYQQSKQEIDYIDSDIEMMKDLFHFYQSDTNTHKIVLASLYGKQNKD